MMSQTMKRTTADAPPTPEEAQDPDTYRRLYEAQGWSQTEAGRQVGGADAAVAQKTISDRVRGRSPIDGEAARAMLWAVEHADTGG